MIVEHDIEASSKELCVRYSAMSLKRKRRPRPISFLTAAVLFTPYSQEALLENF